MPTFALHKSDTAHESRSEVLQRNAFPGARNAEFYGISPDLCRFMLVCQLYAFLASNPQNMHSHAFYAFWMKVRALPIPVDGYSDSFDIRESGRKKTTGKVIKASKRLFSCFGRPAQFRADSDPRYLSSQRKEFSAAWKLKFRTSAPYHHSANGEAESAIEVAKRLVKKCLTQGEHLQLTLLEWRNTPQKDGPQLCGLQHALSRQ